MQFFPDMDDSPKFKPQTGNDFFVDGRSMRPPVPGTVPFGVADFSPEAHAAADWARPYLARRAAFLADDAAYYTGKTGDGDYVDDMPVEVTPDLIRLGAERFDIFCAACHGYEGTGQGMVGRRWAFPVANFLEERFRDPAQRTGKDGYIFEVARDGFPDPAGGFPRMPPYGHALSVEETWAVVAYIRVLQEAHSGTIDDVPPGEREALLSARAAMRGGAGAPAAGQTPAPPNGGGR